MTLPLQFDGIVSARLPSAPLHLAIGMFDGVHLGHRAVIAPALAAAQRTGGTAAVLTFWPHPSALFHPERRTRLIQDSASKARVLGRLGVPVVITERFTTEFAQIEATDFLSWLKQRLPLLAGVYVGDNFRFGHKRKGNVELLVNSGQSLGIEVFRAPRVSVHGGPVSSTRIRTHLEAGEIEAANALLDYPYFAAGEVTSGKKLGRTLGFPTLNLSWSPDLPPRFGVYAVRVEDDSDAAPKYAAVANYGLRPTFEQTAEPKLETHVIGECPFAAGSRILVEWLHFIRPETKFANADALRAQIARDRDEAAKTLALARR